MAYNIQKYTKTLTLLYQSDDNLIEDALHYFNGIVRGIVLVVPNLEGSDTASISLIDDAGVVVYTKTGLAESTTHQLYTYDANNVLQFPLSGNYKISIGTSGAQTANRAFTVALLVER
jgi:hypothetical protein